MTAKTVKPKFLVVESTLKCQTANGELSLPLSVSFGIVRKLMGSDAPQSEFAQFEFFMDNLFSPEQTEALDALDAAEAAAILTEFGDALANRLKVSLGKSAGSEESSTGTEQQ